MVRLELTEEEAELLSRMMQSFLSDLRAEIVATENKEWREDLKEQEAFGRALVQRLSVRQS